MRDEAISMKEKFINDLKAQLNPLPEGIREEILSDINEHFAVGVAQGFSEEDICEKLGNPTAIAEQAVQEYAGAAEGFKHIENSSQAGNAKPFEKVRGRYKFEIDESFADITAFDIHFWEADINFSRSNDNEAHVLIQGTSRTNELVVKNDNGTLVVKSGKKSSVFGLFNWFNFGSTLEVEIYVPAGFAGQITANSTAGDISSENISGDISFTSMAGNLKAIGHAGNKIKLTTSAGNVRAELTNDFAESIKITTAAGNVRLEANDVGEMKLDSAAGNVKADLKKVGETKILSSAGNVKLTAHEVAGDIKLTTAAGNAKVYLPLDVNCRIDVKKPAFGSYKSELAGNPDSPYTLKATTSMGSVKLCAL